MVSSGLTGVSGLLRRTLYRLDDLKRDCSSFFVYGLGAPKRNERIYINPANLNVALKKWCFGREKSGEIVPGDWDLDVVPLDHLKKIQMISRKLECDLSWEDSGMYSLVADLVSRRRKYDGCGSREDIVARYQRLDAFVSHLRSGGRFLNGSELGRWREQGGILVHLGRNGDLIFGRTGCHRLAIARHLGLQVIPVLLGAVHPLAMETGEFKALRKRSGVLSKQR